MCLDSIKSPIEMTRLSSELKGLESNLKNTLDIVLSILSDKVSSQSKNAIVNGRDSRKEFRVAPYSTNENINVVYQSKDAKSVT